MRPYGNKVGNENNNFLKQHCNFSLFMVTFSYSICCYLGVELYKSKSQRGGNSGARAYKVLMPGTRADPPDGGFSSSNNPSCEGAYNSNLSSIFMLHESCELLELAGLSFSYLLFQKPG